MDSSIHWVTSVLITTPQRWIQLTEKLPDALLRRAPAPGEWSALGCLHHLLDTEKMVFPVIVTLDELLHEWAAHDLMHTVQAERALMQPFIARCTPWKPYFIDHWVEDTQA